MKIVKGQTTIKICSINPMICLLFVLLHNIYDFNIVVLTETWLETSVDKACVNELLPSSNYKIKHVPRPAGKRG